MSRCGYRTEKGHRYFIPGCMGGAALGRAYCTCKTAAAAKSEKDLLLNRIDQLEEQVAQLLARSSTEEG